MNVTDQEFSVVAANYGDMEKRIMSAACQDVHLVKASEMFSVPADQVTREQRRAAKIENFYKMYNYRSLTLGK
jgi:DNA polymerase I-like protein with 3'-5' exonuclease and polymerase domains